MNNLKKLSHLNINKLRAKSDKLKYIDGIKSVYSTRKKADLGINGNAFLFIDISKELVDKIWTTMEMSKDGPNSAYADIMDTNNLTLQLLIYKTGNIFSSVFYANAAISFNHMQVKFGSVASKDLGEIITRTQLLITDGIPFEGTTEEALGKCVRNP